MSDRFAVEAVEANGKHVESETKGLKIERVFTQEGVYPEDTVTWETRTAEIKSGDGKVVFRQEGVEVPSTWSQLATNIVASKYFYGDKDAGNGCPGEGKREYSVAQLVGRVANTIADWGMQDGYFASDRDRQAFRDELYWLCLHQHGAFNSPVWFNCGLYSHYGVEGNTTGWRWDQQKGEAVPLEKGEAFKFPQLSACFLQSVEDNMDSIMNLAKSEAMLFKMGSGTGTDLSTLRSTRERLSGGGQPSGPVSFFRVYDAGAGVIKSGGKCLAPGQRVYTETGARTAKELADSGEEFVVLSYSKRLGRFGAKRATAWWSVEKPLVEVTTDKGVFVTSADHPFVLRTGRSVQASALTPGLSLLSSFTVNSNGYHSIRDLLDNKHSKRLFHRMVAEDVIGLDLADNKVIHHKNANRRDNRVANLEYFDTHSDHAAFHNLELVAAGEHVFQKRRFDHTGAANGMSRTGSFYRDEQKVAAYRVKQSVGLRERGTAAVMQQQARRAAMLKLGYELINDGFEIETFDKYMWARYKANRRCGNGREKQLRFFEKHFGSYEAYYTELRQNNHKVLSIRALPPERTVSVEVIDDEPDDKRDWSEHNFAIMSNDSDSDFGTFAFVLNTRRAARMQSLRVDHPDVVEFIECKVKEDRKARALIAAGYSAGMTGDADEAYSSVAYQNTNTAIRLTDVFMRKVTGEDPDPMYWTKAVVDGRSIEQLNANDVLDRIAKAAWECGDPGPQYHDTINAWHTAANTAPINTSNPCGEYNFLDDSACNLASLNLLKFANPDGGFDSMRFAAAVRIFITAQEIIVDRASYPTQAIAENSHNFRPLGLGYANLGALLMSHGLPYDSTVGRSTAGAIAAVMQGEAAIRSATIAKHRGAFQGYAVNREPMLRVMRKHADAAREGFKAAANQGLGVAVYGIWEHANSAWDVALKLGEKHGYINGQLSVQAPTGTIAFAMDCATTGIEPDIALVKYKQLAGGGLLKLTNQTVPLALGRLGYAPDAAQAVIDYIEQHDTIEGAHGLKPEHLSVFDCAFPPPQGGRSISWQGHLKMMAAIQPFISGALSKTVNVCSGTTPEEMREIYIEGWRLGLKAIAVYRDGSKGVQPLNTKKSDDKPEPAPVHNVVTTATIAPSEPIIVHEPHRERLPATRRSLTHKFDVQGHEGYLNVGFYPDGRPGELFVTMAKEGSTVGGLMDSLGTAISIGLQYGVPLENFVTKFAHARFEPSGFTKNKDIPMAKSLVDYIFRWLGNEFIPGYRDANAPRLPEDNHSVTIQAPTSSIQVVPVLAASEAAPGINVRDQQFARFQSDAPTCDNCGSLTVRNGSCYRCFNCGNSLGCS